MRPVDGFAIAVAALLTLISPLLVLGSALWWAAIALAATLVIYFGGHMLWAHLLPKSPFPRAHLLRTFAALYLVVGGLGFSTWYYLNIRTNGWYWHAQIVFPEASKEEPEALPEPPLEGLPMFSRPDKFIVACDVPLKGKSLFDNRQTFTKFVSDWAPVGGFTQSTSEIENGIRIVLEAKTADAQRNFQKLDIVKGVTKVTLDVRRIGRRIVITAFGELPKGQQKLTNATINPSSPLLIDNLIQLARLLWLDDDACYLR